MRYANDNVYKGNWENGKKGVGKMKWAKPQDNNGQEWVEGQWGEGSEPPTSGTERRKNAAGHFYEGTFHIVKIPGPGGTRGRSRIQKKGTLTYGVVYVYTGVLKDDLPDGHGVMTYANGDVYDGAWKKGERKGDGKMTWKSPKDHNEQIWVWGTWRGPMNVETPSSGEERRMTKEGHDYEGKFKLTVTDGVETKEQSGKLTYLVTSSAHAGSRKQYKGALLNDVPDGEGTMQWEGGSEFKGEWKAGIPVTDHHGAGKLKNLKNFPGVVYEGPLVFASVAKDGEQTAGLLRIPYKISGGAKAKFSPASNGGEYEGELVGGQAHGLGTMVFSSDENSTKDTHTSPAEYTGNWEKGRPHGIGSMRLKSGSEYTGQWMNGKPHGDGKMWIAKYKLSVSSSWNNGVPLMGKMTITTQSCGRLTTGDHARETCGLTTKIIDDSSKLQNDFSLSPEDVIFKGAVETPIEVPMMEKVVPEKGAAGAVSATAS
eukprot:g11264.t1